MQPDAIHVDRPNERGHPTRSVTDWQTDRMEPFLMSYDTSNVELDVNTATSALGVLNFVQHLSNDG